MRIAMIGIKAIPAHFGGFETAVDELSRGLVRRGHHVVVYNRRGMSELTGNSYEGVELVTLPTLQTKNLSTIFHSFLATLHVMFTDVDVVHYFTAGATLFAPLARISGKRIVCSVDGTDWQRNKWGPFARRYLRNAEAYAVRVCDALVADSKEVEQYYRNKYAAESFPIAYGVREHKTADKSVLHKFGLIEREYVLFVGRLVPENNVHYLIRAFEQTTTKKKLVIVGDDPWEKHYVRSLKLTSDPRILFTGGVYGEGYAQLQQNAYVFVLPDEVGGTHPALVEAMGFGNCVLVNDTPSNLEVVGDAGFSYQGSRGSEDLYVKLQILLDDSGLVSRYRVHALSRAEQKYRWSSVVEEHIKMYQSVLNDHAAESRPELSKAAD
jgi:glycosyltransferase involved in cell wall biosynthesis